MRDLEASQLPPSRHWSKQEHALFLEALQQVGPTSNIKISRIVGTKTAAQVGRHKRIFLCDHPGWIEQLQKQQLDDLNISIKQQSTILTSHQFYHTHGTTTNL